MSTLKFAIVGCGHIGKRHINVIENEAGARLTCLCDNNPEVGKELAVRFPEPVFYSDYQKMLAEGDFDIVSICTPHGLHAEMSIQAARAKKQILVEKPMALNSADSEKMIQAAKEEGVRLFVVKQNRFNAPIFAVKKALDENRLGHIFLVQSNVLWNRNTAYYQDSPWKGRKNLEGGALFTQASHFIDLLIWWFGDIQSPQTLMDTLNHDIEIEDVGISAFRFENGALGSLTWTTCVYNVNYEGSILIVGEKGTVKIGGKYLNQIEFWDVQSYPEPNLENDDQPNNYGSYQGSSSNHDKLVTELIEEIIQRRKGLVEGEEGLKCIHAIEEIYAAAEK